MSVLNGINEIIGCFKTYASKDGDHSTISKDELRDLLKEQFGQEIKPEQMDSYFVGMDENCDKRLDFEEFMTAVKEFILLAYFSGLPSKD